MLRPCSVLLTSQKIRRYKTAEKRSSQATRPKVAPRFDSFGIASLYPRSSRGIAALELGSLSLFSVLAFCRFVCNIFKVFVLTGGVLLACQTGTSSFLPYSSG